MNVKQEPVIIFLLTVALVNGIDGYTGCQYEFVKRCHCGPGQYRGAMKYITNCTNSGFTNPTMLRQLPIETEVLIFTGNNIKSLPPNLFGNSHDYLNLTDIDLSNNSIQAIEGKAFHHVPNVKRLILNNNRWKVDNHTRLFANMEYLEELYLNAAFDIGSPDYIDATDASYNSSIKKLMHFFEENPLLQLKAIHLNSNKIGPILNLGIFSRLVKLEHISLANNSILQVLLKDIHDLPQLTYLDLSNNHIPFLFNETMKNLDDIPDLRLNLSGNNFNCDCGMTDFQHWLRDTHVHVLDKDTYKCQDGYPENNAGQLVLHLPESLLQCEKLLDMYPLPSLGIAQVVLIMIVVLFCTLLLVVGFINRRIISHTFQRFGEPLYRRMKYSAISKQAAENEIEI